MKLTWFGTAAVAFSCNDTTIIFDPFVPLKGAENPTPVSAYDGYNTIFITHGHFDHIKSLPYICERNPKAQIYATKTPVKTLKDRGLFDDNLHEISYDASYSVGPFEIHVMHGKHAILPKFSFHRLFQILMDGHWGNIIPIIKGAKEYPENDETIFYDIKADGKHICLLGSMNLRDEISYPTQMDVLLLPYNGWEDNYSPAVAIIERLKPKRILLHHYDNSFPPVSSDLDLTPILKKYGDIIMPLPWMEEISI